MRIAYFDCFAGISGDMILGALLNAGLELERLQAELDKLGVAALHLEQQSTSRQAIAAVRATVHAHGHAVQQEDEDHLDLHPEAHPEHEHRHPGDVIGLIESSALAPQVRASSVRIFQRLTAAEAAVHGSDPEHVHLHEVGAMDAIADVVGTVAGLALLGVEAVYSSPLHLGSGFVNCAHGRYPVPVPGVLALCEDIPCVQTDIPAELVTPTGAAIITTLATGFGSPPPFRQHQVGYGAGRRELDAVPNLLRVRIGETATALEHDQLVLVETNIDDMNPEVFGYLTDLLLQQGARDVYITPVYMKKGRPGSLLSVLAEESDLDLMVHTLLSETTSIGVRFHQVERRKLKRENVSVETPYGRVRVKLCQVDGTRRGNPEYDDCARLAKQHQVPILSIYDAARVAFARE